MQYPDNNPLLHVDVKTPEGNPPAIITQKITVRPINRQPQDIGTWRNANRSAEAMIPRRVQLYDLYEDVMLDGHVIAVTTERIQAVTNAKWKFVDKDGKDVDAVNFMIDSMGFEDMITEIIKSKFWGYSMAEFTFFKDEDGNDTFSTYEIPKKHMRPDLGIVAEEQTGYTGINIREGIYLSTILEVGKEKDLGLLLSVAQYAIFKRGGFSDWSQFVECFGQPLVDATWDGFDEQQRLQLLNSINTLGNGGALVHPAGTEIKLIENKANSDGKLQGNFIAALNKEISKAILGSTETVESSDSSGYAQSETHEDGVNDKNDSDVNFTRRILNTRVRKILKANGIDLKGGKFIIEGDENKLSLKEAYDVQKSMVEDLGIPIDDDFFYETYNVPKPADYDAQKAALLAEKALMQQSVEPTNPKDDASTPGSSGGKKGPKPKADAPGNSKKPTKLRKLLNGYRHFFE